MVRDVMKGVLWSFLILMSVMDVDARQLQDWGDVTSAEWETDYFPDDDEAHSVVLFDVGESYIDRSLKVVHTRHKRVKIIDPENSVYADMEISVYGDRNVQSMRKLEAHTLNMRPDGSVERTEVGKREFYSEKSGDWEVNTFAFPALREGSIIEYRYTMIYGSPVYMPDWEFQESSPVVHSEYRVMVPDFLTYNVYMYGYETFENTRDTSELERKMLRYANAAKGYSRNMIYHIILKDAPAIRAEPFISSLSNYRNSVKFNLSGYTDEYGRHQGYLNTWEEIADQLAGNRYFGVELRSKRKIRSVVNELTDGIDSDYDKAVAIYNYVASSIQWDGKFRMFTTDRLTDVLDTRTGTSADKSLLLTNMLRTAGLDANPVLISTRENGVVDWGYARLEPFNHVLSLLTIGEQLYLLDPVDDIIPFGVLYPSSINKNGLLLREEKASIVDIGQQMDSSTHTVALMSVGENGEISSQLNTKYSGYEAIIHRRLAEMEGEESYIEETMLEYLPDSRLEESKLIAIDNPEEPFSVELTFENDRYGAVAGDMIYLNPFLVERISENPFTNPKRAFPVEFNFKSMKNYMTTITIPSTFEVVEIPESGVHQFSENMTFRLVTQVVDNSIQLMMTMLNGESEIPSEYYEDLRKYYTALADTYNQQIILKRKSPDDVEEPISAESGE